jgi:hypothetical protein
VIKHKNKTKNNPQWESQNSKVVRYLKRPVLDWRCSTGGRMPASASGESLSSNSDPEKKKKKKKEKSNF